MNQQRTYDFQKNFRTALMTGVILIFVHKPLFIDAMGLDLGLGTENNRRAHIVIYGFAFFIGLYKSRFHLKSEELWRRIWGGLLAFITILYLFLP